MSIKINDSIIIKYRHQYDCPLSLYDLYLQHGCEGAGYNGLIFLAYRIITQKSKSFIDSLFNNKNCHLYVEPFNANTDEKSHNVIINQSEELNDAKTVMNHNIQTSDEGRRWSVIMRPTTGLETSTYCS